MATPGGAPEMPELTCAEHCTVAKGRGWKFGQSGIALGCVGIDKEHVIAMDTVDPSSEDPVTRRAFKCGHWESGPAMVYTPPFDAQPSGEIQ